MLLLALMLLLSLLARGLRLILTESTDELLLAIVHDETLEFGVGDKVHGLGSCSSNKNLGLL